MRKGNGKEKTAGVIQTGLFETDDAEGIRKAMAYIGGMDETVVEKTSARIYGMVRPADRPGQEAVVLVKARDKSADRMLYKFYVTADEIHWPGANWMNSEAMFLEARHIGASLKKSGHAFTFEGDRLVEPAFGLKNEYLVTLYGGPLDKEGAMVVVAGIPGIITQKKPSGWEGVFAPVDTGYEGARMLRRYVGLRDLFVTAVLAADENAENIDALAAMVAKEFNAFAGEFGRPWEDHNASLVNLDKTFGEGILKEMKKAFVPGGENMEEEKQRGRRL